MHSKHFGGIKFGGSEKDCQTAKPPNLNHQQIFRLYGITLTYSVPNKVCFDFPCAFFFKQSNNRHTQAEKSGAIVQQTIGITDNVAVHQYVHCRPV